MTTLSELRKKITQERDTKKARAFVKPTPPPSAEVVLGDKLRVAEFSFADGKEVGGRVEFYVGGGLARVSRGRIVKPLQGKLSPRGDIKTFTPSARRRLMRLVAMTRREMVPVFVTLTYPGTFDSSPERWKRDLHLFAVKFTRKFPKASFVWKLEFQRRGAPHYHLLVWGVTYAELLPWVGPVWYKVVGSGDERHLHAGTRVEWLRSYRGAIAYASKYLAKVTQETIQNVGRWWGVVNRACLPWAELVVCPVDDKTAKDIIRYFKKFAGVQNRRQAWAWSLMCDASHWFERLGLLPE